MGILIARIVVGLIFLAGVALIVALYYLSSKYLRHQTGAATTSSIMYAGSDPGVAGFGGGAGGGGGCDGGGGAC